MCIPSVRALCSTLLHRFAHARSLRADTAAWGLLLKCSQLPAPPPPVQLGWVRSWSCWPPFVADRGEAAQQSMLGALGRDLQAALGTPDRQTPVHMVWPLTVVLARKPVPL